MNTKVDSFCSSSSSSSFFGELEAKEIGGVEGDFKGLPI